MMPNLPSPAPTPAGGPGASPAPRRRPWLLYGCGLLLGLLLLVVATVAMTVWYLQRPIQPVQLSTSEKAVVEKKLDRLGHTPDSASRAPGASTPSPSPSPRVPGAPVPESAVTMLEVDRPYEPGAKVLRLTERELNGLLNANTDLGKTVRLELGRDAINAYVTAPIPEDVPIMGGKMFRARGRFRVALTNDATACAILEDVTVFGLSLPKAWLGGIKGENLLGDAMGTRQGSPILKGIKSLRVEPGALVLEIAD